MYYVRRSRNAPRQQATYFKVPELNDDDHMNDEAIEGEESSQQKPVLYPFERMIKVYLNKKGELIVDAN